MILFFATFLISQAPPPPFYFKLSFNIYCSAFLVSNHGWYLHSGDLICLSFSFWSFSCFILHCMSLRDQDQSERQPGENCFGNPEGTPCTKISANHRSYPRLDVHAHPCVQIFTISHLKLNVGLREATVALAHCPCRHIEPQYLHMLLRAMACLQQVDVPWFRKHVFQEVHASLGNQWQSLYCIWLIKSRTRHIA